MVRILSFNLTGEIGKNQVLYACGWMLSSMKERQLVQTLEAFSLIFYIFLNFYGWSCFFIAFTNIVLINLKKQILEFIQGKREKFSIKLHIRGSSLQKKIWKQLSNIRYGNTKTYGEIAGVLRTSPRYVGNVCGQNNHLLVIPCHRVVRTDGTLGGFSGLGGIKLKQKLLKLEQA